MKNAEMKVALVGNSDVIATSFLTVMGIGDKVNGNFTMFFGGEIPGTPYYYGDDYTADPAVDLADLLTAINGFFGYEGADAVDATLKVEDEAGNTKTLAQLSGGDFPEAFGTFNGEYYFSRNDKMFKFLRPLQ